MPSPFERLRETVRFAPSGTPVGNLTLGAGSVDARPVAVALLENRIASGSVGVAEARALAKAIDTARSEGRGLVMGIDSAGARVSQGLEALGAFRALYRSGLEAAVAGTPMAAVLGTFCYGGASMLAHLAPQRLFSPRTRLAMSGPAILASSAGMGATDEMFLAIAEAAMGPSSRMKASAANRVADDALDLAAWLREALAPRGDPLTSARMRHEALATRLPPEPAPSQAEAVQRRDLERIYGGRYEAREAQGFLEGRGTRDGAEESFLGIVGSAPLGIGRAWRFADAAWRLADAPPKHVEVFLDCASHAARLEDERAVQSEFIVDASLALAALAARGSRVGLTILGKAGGGVYVALAAPAARVATVHGADIQVLPGAAVAAILGETRESVPSFADYLPAGVAETELKLGLVPRTP